MVTLGYILVNAKAFKLKNLLWIVTLTLAVACSPTVTATPATTAPPAVSTPARAASPTPGAVPGPTRPAPPKLGAFDPATVAHINLDDYPIVPVVNPALRAIYTAGLTQGHNPRVFSKLGDCMTETEYFLTPLGSAQTNLGEYTSLQAVIDQFQDTPARNKDWDKDSFATLGLAAAGGFNIAGPFDPTWSNPKWCGASESPLDCEYRVAQPSFAIIMFGTNDVAYTEPDTYNYYLRTLIAATLDKNILPLLSTFPTRLENPEKSALLNRIVVQIATDYGLPVMNLNRALEPLPNHGVDPADPIHLSVPPDKQVTNFDPDHLQYGFPMRNLVTLQALAAVWQAVK